MTSRTRVTSFVAGALVLAAMAGFPAHAEVVDYRAEIAASVVYQCAYQQMQRAGSARTYEDAVAAMKLMDSPILNGQIEAILPTVIGQPSEVREAWYTILRHSCDTRAAE